MRQPPLIDVGKPQRGMPLRMVDVSPVSGWIVIARCRGRRVVATGKEIYLDRGSAELFASKLGPEHAPVWLVPIHCEVPTDGKTQA